MPTKKAKPRILAVDDSRVMRRAMSKVLSKSYDVIEAENGEDAWTILTNDDSIQVVFTDLNMPYLDGYGLLERIRASKNARLKETPVVIITGKDDDEKAKQEALDKGANDFITKPFDSIQLQARAKAHVTFKQTKIKLTETSNKLERQATIDETTGLGGRRYFNKVGDETLSYANRHNGQFIIVRLDIDNFNNLFIKYGKKIINSILKTLGKKLSQLIRQENTFARIGVSKFALILKETNMEDAHKLTMRMRNEIQKMTFELPDNSRGIKLTISAGLYEPEAKSKLSFSEHITETETYLNDAISAGGNKIVAQKTGKAGARKQTGTLDILELLKKLKKNKPEELLPQIDSILLHLTPLLKFLAKNAGKKLQAIIKK